MILVFGHNGQLATELRLLGADGLRALGRDQADLMVPGACAKAIHDHAPEAVINAAAYTAVDAAEEDEDAAMRINGVAPGEMAQACAALGIPLVHVSTDYVFDGSGEQHWLPSDAPAPLGVYGRSKLAGEQAVAAADGPHVILRTSWVFSAHGNNFVKTMLRLGAERDSLRVVADQIGGPTAAADIARACLSIAEQLCHTPEKSGIQHFAGAPDISWAGFARETFAQAGLACSVEDIPSSQYPTPAARPHNSRMDCSGLSDFEIVRPDWRRALNDVLISLGALS